MPDPVLPRSFYQLDPETVARSLLGHRLVTRIGGKRTSGLIVETEAYLADGDPAAHSARGLGKSNAAMFGPAGHAYVYPIHSRFCFNVVTESANVGSAVLIRSLQPDEGISLMATRRGKEEIRLLTTGPGRLCGAMMIDRQLDHCDLTTRRTVWIERVNGVDQKSIFVTPRIGVTSAKDYRLRFVIKDNPFVSGPRRLRSEIGQ